MLNFGGRNFNNSSAYTSNNGNNNNLANSNHHSHTNPHHHNQHSHSRHVATNGQLLNAGLLIGQQPQQAAPSAGQEFTLNVICSVHVNQDQLWRLFDIIPGLDYCQITGELGSNSHCAIVKYNNWESCVYARDKLHGLEYPLGERLIVKLDLTNPLVSAAATASASITSVSPTTTSGGGRSLSSTDGKFSLQQQALLDRDTTNLCSVPLPASAPLAFTGSACVQRCFLVCVSQV